MPNRIGLRGALGLTMAFTAACDTGPQLDLPAPVPVAVPAPDDASLPHVAETGDGAILSWVEPADSGHALRFARWDGTAWSEPRTVAQGSDWFVNWADFPSVVPVGDGRLAAHWLQRSGAGTYAYDVMISQSADAGATWSEPVRPHADGTPTEHGFVSLFPANGAVGVVWLDGRKYAGESATNEMTVRYAELDAPAARPTPGAAGDNLLRPTVVAPAAAERVLDERACDCCQTAVALTGRGPLVAYRDRSPDEIRDVAVTRLRDGAWSEPVRVHADEWQIDACPVNGPQADAVGDDVAIAWFTAANDSPLVRVAFSSDAGETFGEPTRVDTGNPVGRVDVLLLDSGRALVLWLERTAAGGAVMARLVAADGTLGEPATIASTLAQRTSGFPRMARYAAGVLVAWTEPGDPSRVRAAALPLQ